LPTPNEGEESITFETFQSSVRFFDAFPPGRVWPKIAPDDEGTLILVWEECDEPLTVTIDGMWIHAVISATKPYAQYIEDLPFLGLEIPTEILSAIPFDKSGA